MEKDGIPEVAPGGDTRFTVSAPEYPVPAGACDCHVHVFGPYRKYPLAEGRAYTPPEASLDEARHVIQTLGMSRFVLVQPSPYGTDNRCLLDALLALGDRGRGIAVLGPETAATTIREMHEAGVRGVRINGKSVGMDDAKVLTRRIEQMARIIEPFGWHIQLFVDGGLLPVLLPTLEVLPVHVVLDHMADVSPSEATDSPIRDALSRLLDTGRAWIKLSGTYRLSDVDQLHAPEFARDLAATRPDRLVWGSDWPHTGIHAADARDVERVTPFRSLDTGVLLSNLMAWISDPTVQRRILVQNPAQLYEFD
jgi:predicted TIM-barrel fold metal-dependent hydrolase